MTSNNGTTMDNYSIGKFLSDVSSSSGERGATYILPRTQGRVSDLLITYSMRPLESPGLWATPFFVEQEESVQIDSSQRWYWTKAWQELESEADAALASGNVESFENMDDLLNTL